MHVYRNTNSPFHALSHQIIYKYYLIMSSPDICTRNWCVSETRSLNCVTLRYITPINKSSSLNPPAMDKLLQHNRSTQQSTPCLLSTLFAWSIHDTTRHDRQQQKNLIHDQLNNIHLPSYDMFNMTHNTLITKIIRKCFCPNSQKSHETIQPGRFGVRYGR